MEAVLANKETLLKATADYANSKASGKGLPGLKVLKAFCGVRKFTQYETILKALRPICAIIDALEGDSYPTLSLVQSLALGLHTAVGKLLEDEEQKQVPSQTCMKFFRSVLSGVCNRFLYKPLDQCQGYMPVDYLAWALDPRVKDLKLLRHDNDRDAVWRHLDYLVRNIALKPPPEASSSSSQCDDFDVFSLLNTSPQKPIQRGRDRYLLCPEVTEYHLMQTAKVQVDPLAWWKLNAPQFPRLALLARTYLSIPASSATVERLFSRGGLVRFLSLS